MVDDVSGAPSGTGSHAPHGAGHAVSALSGFDPSRIRADIHAIITKQHDREMNNAGFVRDADSRWVASRHPDADPRATVAANALFMARYLVDSYLANIR